ncbi:MAG: thiamine biosynthesis lipoprotein [Bradymonadia bacterium]|jgi:thiamine biosynthesis lipoprotein
MPSSSSPLGDRPLRRFLPPAIFVIALISVWLYRQPDPRVLSTFRGQTMGTTYTVKVISAVPLNGEQNVRVGGLIQRALAEVNQGMSTYIDDSELSRLNQNRSTAPIKASPALVALLEDARGISEASGGAFDVTIGPLVNAWGFGPSGRGTPPDAAQVAALSQKIGYQKLGLTVAPGSGQITKGHPEMYVDLSAIAKGHGVDRVFATLNETGYADLFVEIGGETRAAGKNAFNKAWRVGIEKPVAGQRAILKAVPLRGVAMATSGDYRNFYEQDGQRISHTIDARTGRPITHRLASVSVVHPRCAIADGWATALNVLGPQEGFALAQTQGLAALFLVRGADGVHTEKMTDAMRAILGE